MLKTIRFYLYLKQHKLLIFLKVVGNAIQIKDHDKFAKQLLVKTNASEMGVQCIEGQSTHTLIHWET